MNVYPKNVYLVYIECELKAVYYSATAAQKRLRTQFTKVTKDSNSMYYKDNGAGFNEDNWIDTHSVLMTGIE